MTETLHKDKTRERREKIRILVVEDEDGVRNLVTRYLEGLGYQISSAENGQAALQLLEELSDVPHLLLSDVVMPELDGPGLALQLRPEFPEMRILFVSGFSDNRFAIEGLQRSDYAFLAKPFALVDLAAKIEELLADLPIDSSR